MIDEEFEAKFEDTVLTLNGERLYVKLVTDPSDQEVQDFLADIRSSGDDRPDAELIAEMIEVLGQLQQGEPS